MRMFLLVFNDLLEFHKPVGQRNNKPVTRRVRAEFLDDLIKKLGLRQRTDIFTDCYWDGKNGEVVISLHEIAVEEIINQEELNMLVVHLFEKWY